MNKARNKCSTNKRSSLKSKKARRQIRLEISMFQKNLMQFFSFHKEPCQNPHSEWSWDNSLDLLLQPTLGNLRECEKKIIFFTRQGLQLWDKNIKFILSKNVSMSFSSKRMLEDWNWRTPITDYWTSKRTTPPQEELFMKKKCRELKNTRRLFFCTKIDSKSWNNTKRSLHKCWRAYEFHECFGEILRSWIESQREIMLRFQSAKRSAKFSCFVQLR